MKKVLLSFAIVAAGAVVALGAIQFLAGLYGLIPALPPRTEIVRTDQLYFTPSFRGTVTIEDMDVLRGFLNPPRSGQWHVLLGTERGRMKHIVRAEEAQFISARARNGQSSAFRVQHERGNSDLFQSACKFIGPLICSKLMHEREIILLPEASQ